MAAQWWPRDFTSTFEHGSCGCSNVGGRALGRRQTVAVPTYVYATEKR